MTADTETRSLADRLNRLIRLNQAAGRRSNAVEVIERPRETAVEENPVADIPVAAAASEMPGSAGHRGTSRVLVPETPVAAESEAPAPAGNGGTSRVLVAESDPLHRQVLARLIETAGYQVDTAANAGEAVAAFQPGVYAAVMLDCDSAEMRGFETAGVLRQVENGAGRTPIIAITSSGDQSHRKRRKAAGIDNYVAKPILRENVESVLARYAPTKSVEPLPRYLALDRHRLVELDQLAGNRPELLCGWIELFLTGAPDLLDRMRAAHEDRKVADLHAAAVQLRSRAGQFGAMRVQEICGIIAALCESRSLAGVESLLPELSLAIERAGRELRSLASGVRAGLRLARAAGDVPAARARGSAGDNHVLLAEEDPLIARFLTNSLTGAGLQVTHVTSGRAAVDELRAKKFGALIVDLAVPEVDGYGVLSEARVPPADTTPVLILSSRHQEQHILRAFELGADDFVTIPFNPMEVVARVRRLLKQGAHVS